MSRIDDLIREHCPGGVQRIRLGDLIDYEQPGKYLVKSASYDDSFTTPVLTAGKTFILGYTDEKSGIYPASPDAPVVIFDDFTTAFRWVDFPFKAKSSAMKILTPKPGVSLRYVWFAMQLIRYAPQDHARQWIGTYSTFQIPVPPLEVQREIVKVLDTFTELEAEVEAELEARRLQYAHYRDALLSFPEGDVPRVPMGELGQFIRGRRFTKADMVESGLPCIHYGEIYTHYGVSTESTLSRVDAALGPSLRFAEPNDVVIAGVGETVEDVAKAVAWLGSDRVAIHDDSFAFRSDADPRYIAYAMQTREFHAQKTGFVSRAKVKRISGSDLGKIVVPVPPLEVQRRIADTLDRFDALVNSLTDGLPAEIEARRQQYEYYRDKLLTFEEIVA